MSNGKEWREQFSADAEADGVMPYQIAAATTGEKVKADVAMAQRILSTVVVPACEREDYATVSDALFEVVNGIANGPGPASDRLAQGDDEEVLALPPSLAALLGIDQDDEDGFPL